MTRLFSLARSGKAKKGIGKGQRGHEHTISNLRKKKASEKEKDGFDGRSGRKNKP